MVRGRGGRGAVHRQPGDRPARAQAVIDASPGLGEAVVSGAVNPDHFVVDVATGAVLRAPARRQAAWRSAPCRRGRHRAVGRAAAERRLPDRRAARGAGRARRRVEAHFGAPQDIEWARRRAGAALADPGPPDHDAVPAARRGAGDADLRVYFNFNVAQGVFRPLTPMGLAAFRRVARRSPRLCGRPGRPTRWPAPPALVDGRPGGCSSTSRALAAQPGRARAPAPAVLDVMEARSATVLRALFDDPRFARCPSARWPLVGRAGALAARSRLPLPAASARWSDPAAARRRGRRGWARRSAPR